MARIDEYGVAYVDVPVGAASLFLQAGDGWDRVIWTTPPGRAYEWQWDLVRGPKQVSALVDGQGAERLTYLGGDVWPQTSLLMARRWPRVVDCYGGCFGDGSSG